MYRRLGEPFSNKSPHLQVPNHRVELELVKVSWDQMRHPKEDFWGVQGFQGGWIIWSTRWAPTKPINGVISYNPYEWPYNWVTRVLTLIIGVVTLFLTGDRLFSQILRSKRPEISNKCLFPTGLLLPFSSKDQMNHIFDLNDQLQIIRTFLYAIIHQRLHVCIHCQEITLIQIQGKFMAVKLVIGLSVVQEKVVSKFLGPGWWTLSLPSLGWFCLLGCSNQSYIERGMLPCSIWFLLKPIVEIHSVWINQ